MKATIFHNPECGTSRKTLERLREAGADVTIVEYLKSPPARAELKRLYDRAGIKPSEGVRKREPLATELGLLDGLKSEDDILDALAAHPRLIERPLVETAKGVALCRPVEEVDKLL